MNFPMEPGMATDSARCSMMWISITQQARELLLFQDRKWKVATRSKADRDVKIGVQTIESFDRVSPEPYMNTRTSSKDGLSTTILFQETEHTLSQLSLSLVSVQINTPADPVPVANSCKPQSFENQVVGQ
mmetsp:Transcript_3522/g.5009  ORF Transcript_3522/g.5009 Transcript_3522/m.5009 type:complete len:130 (-) Transcript_3522:133-522(-)